ncbi:terminase [Mycobacterium phage Yoshi]|uniref:Terminase n=1 Tax=Mycobacterium phage Yoshi TaxID=2920891 RepID=G1BSM6_9CAUD|nr:terminase [Mycobacterium phage Yoshi]AEK07754.1 terminase [Mycobacterium phage Yoshi]
MPIASGSRVNPAPLVDIARQCFIPDDIAFTRYNELIAPELPGMGIVLDRWQEDIWYAALGLREDGTLACDVMGVTLSIARQAGKTWGIMVGLIAICLSRPGTLVIWSSHHDRTSSETLTKIAGIVEKPAIRPKMRAQHPVVQTDDSRGVHFANGSRILFGARSAGFGRGFSEVDIQVYDECQNLKDSALTDMLAAMNVSEIGLAFFMGTPPRPQEVALGVHDAFKRRRDKALAPVKKRPFKGIYVEFSPENPKDVVADIDAPRFWEKLAEVNPSFGFRVGKSAIERLVENMSPEDVRREVFGIWDKTNETLAVVPRDQWNNLAADVDVDPEDVAAYGINATRSGWYWITACWREGESAHVEIALGTQSEVEAMNFMSRHATKRTPIKHDSTGAAKALGEKLKKLYFNASAYTQNEAGAGNALWLSLVEQGRLSHDGQQDLELAVRGSRRQDRTSGGWMLVPRSESFDIGPAISMSGAVYAAMTARRPSGNSRATHRRKRHSNGVPA